MNVTVFRNSTCALIIAMFLSTAMSMSAENSKPIKVFLLGGQSNMDGAGKVADLPPPYTHAVSNVKIWRGRSWVPLAPLASKTFGPEISFGHAISEAMPDDDIRLVKFAVGGSALYNDWAPTEGRKYLGFMNTAKLALANLDAEGAEYKIAGMLWLQGESDAKENKADTYEDNLTAFIAHMRTKFKTPEMPFIIARVLGYYGGKSGQAKIVRDAQAGVAESTRNVAWFNTDDCELQNAGHYNASGLIKIGKRFAAAYMQTTDKTRANAKK